MVLEDWEIKYESEGQILWRNKKTNSHIQINEYYDDGWYFHILGMTKHSKKINTKSQALKFTKQYMKIH